MWRCWCDAELVLTWAIITQSMACNYLTRIKKWPLEQILRQRRGALLAPGACDQWTGVRWQAASNTCPGPDTGLVTMILSDFRLRQGISVVRSDKNLSSLSWYWKPFTPSVLTATEYPHDNEILVKITTRTQIFKDIYLKVCTKFLTFKTNSIYLGFVYVNNIWILL